MKGGKALAKTAETPPRGYVSLTYASNAGQKSAILISHGRILALVLGSLFLTGWFFVSTLGTAALVLVPSLRTTVFSMLVGTRGTALGDGGTTVPPPVQGLGTLASGPKDVPTVPESRAAGESSGKVEKVPPESQAKTQPEEPTVAPSRGVEVLRFDRTYVETSPGKLEFRFFLNLLEKGRRHTGRIWARAQFRTVEGKVLYVPSTLEGKGEAFWESPEAGEGVPFTMRHAVRHDLVFVAPPKTRGHFVGVVAKALSDVGGLPTSVTMETRESRETR